MLVSKVLIPNIFVNYWTYMLASKVLIPYIFVNYWIIGRQFWLVKC
jgi:hypothetical protein